MTEKVAEHSHTPAWNIPQVTHSHFFTLANVSHIHSDKNLHFKRSWKIVLGGILFNKTQSVFGFSLVEFVLSRCRGGVERVHERRAWVRTPVGSWALEHVGKTISYSQMLSGHYSSYAWTPQGHANTQLRKALGLRVWTTARRNRLQGIFSGVSSGC